MGLASMLSKIKRGPAKLFEAFLGERKSCQSPIQDSEKERLLLDSLFPSRFAGF